VNLTAVHAVQAEAPVAQECLDLSGKYGVIWRERIEPLHDLILEALLDNVQAAVTTGS
jgi:hypothetical protein